MKHRNERHLGAALAAMLAIVAFSGDARAEDLCPAAEPLYRQGDYPKFVDELRRLSKDGDVGCMARLGAVLRDGVIVVRDVPGAIAWYRKSAEAGNAFAQFELATMYDNGFGVPKDQAEAARWYTLAADQGFVMALRNLAVLYDEGHGVPQDKAKAAELYEKADEAQPGVGWLPK